MCGVCSLTLPQGTCKNILEVMTCVFICTHVSEPYSSHMFYIISLFCAQINKPSEPPVSWCPGAGAPCA